MKTKLLNSKLQPWAGSYQSQDQMQPQQQDSQSHSQMLYHQQQQSSMCDNAQYQAQMAKQPTSYNSQYDNFLANQGYQSGGTMPPQYPGQMSQMYSNQQHYSYNKQAPNQQNVRNQPIKYRDK